jgi:hypothetical protein
MAAAVAAAAGSSFERRKQAQLQECLLWESHAVSTLVRVAEEGSHL